MVALGNQNSATARAAVPEEGSLFDAVESCCHAEEEEEQHYPAGDFCDSKSHFE